MKVAVIGSRDFDDYDRVKRILDLYPISAIVSGGARGADSLGKRYSEEVLGKDAEIYNAEWSDLTKEPCKIKTRSDGSKYNALAGFNRNTTIIQNCDMVVAFWDAKSPGTKDSIDKAQELRKTTLIAYF